MEEFGVLDAGRVERGGGDIQGDDGILANGSGFDMAGPTILSGEVSQQISKPERASLDAIFRPKTVAVIGATEAAGSVGRTVLANLLASPFAGQYNRILKHDTGELDQFHKPIYEDWYNTAHYDRVLFVFLQIHHRLLFNRLRISNL